MVEVKLACNSINYVLTKHKLLLQGQTYLKLLSMVIIIMVPSCADSICIKDDRNPFFPCSPYFNNFDLWFRRRATDKAKDSLLEGHRFDLRCRRVIH